MPDPAKKLIQVVNVNQKPISFIDQQTGQPKTFVVYQVMANDGITYETNDAQFFATFAVGQQKEIQYTIKSRQKGTKVYTSYVLVNPNAKPRFGANNAEVLDAMRKVYARIEQAEQNILAALNLQNVKVVDEVDIPVINEEIQAVAEEINEAESVQGTSPGGMPF